MEEENLTAKAKKAKKKNLFRLPRLRGTFFNS
jgi:hypothetical protein